MAYNVYEALKLFPITIKSESDVTIYGNGHINDTYLVKTTDADYIFQKINKNIFTNPPRLMDNVVLVTKRIEERKKADGSYTPDTVLRVIPANDGKAYAVSEGEYFRLYNFVNGISYDSSGLEILYKAGKAFGDFQNALDGFDASALFETIVNFHNTKKRFADFKKAVADNLSGRAVNAKKDIELALSYESATSVVVDALADKSLPLRVTHNDTKLNNILFDKNSGRPICVVDLDTIMPGYSVTDFGDSIRFGATTALEDEADLSKVNFDISLYELYVKGFIEGAKGGLTPAELELLPIGAIMMTYECGMRFLTDYISGDTYFKITREKHNLDRARNQFKLVSDMEKQLDKMREIVKKYSH